MPDDLATNNSSTAQSSSVSHVAVKMPIFTTGNPSLFFRRAEAQFCIANITTQLTKYYYIFSALPDAVAELCGTDSTGDAPYDTLRNEVLAICDRTRHSKLADAFADLTISNERPSILLRRVRRIFAEAGVQAADDVIIHKLMQALPPSLAELLHAHTSQPVDDFIKVADTVWSAHSSVSHPQQTVVARASLEPRASFSPRVDTVRATIPTHLRPYRPDQSAVVCRAHLYYGRNARSCRDWCQFPSELLRRNSTGPFRRQQSRSRGSSPAPGNDQAVATPRPSRQQQMD